MTRDPGAWRGQIIIGKTFPRPVIEMSGAQACIRKSLVLTPREGEHGRGHGFASLSSSLEWLQSGSVRSLGFARRGFAHVDQHQSHARRPGLQ
jgi:hypothetical protein